MGRPWKPGDRQSAGLSRVGSRATSLGQTVSTKGSFVGASQKRPLQGQLKAVTQPSTQQIKKMRGVEYGRLCKKKKTMQP